MSLHLIEGPAVPVVSLAATKAHLRVVDSDDDDLITAMVAACTAHIDGRDGWLRRALMAQTWELRSGEFYGPLRLPLPPLIEVVSVTYYDDADALQTASTDLYEVTEGQARQAEVVLKSGQSWPTLYDRSAPVIVRFRAGYVDTGNSPTVGEVPAPIVAAIKLMVGALYANRETIVIGVSAVELPWAAEALLKSYRVFE